MRSLALRTAALAATALAVAGCSDPTGMFGPRTQGEGYCAALMADRTQFADMLNGGPNSLMDGLPMLRSLADNAPADISPAWQTFVGAVEGLQQALAKAGVKASDFQNGTAPAGLDPAKAAAITAAANTLSSPETSAAATSVEQQARDVCHINLGM